MKKTSFVILAAAASVTFAVLPGSAETLPEKTGVNSTLGIAPTSADFVNEAAISDMFEIQSSKLPQASADSKLKAFASKMVADHTKSTSEMKPLAEKAHLTVPAALDDKHQKMLDDLKKLKGADFTTEYSRDQLSGHKDAVSLFQRYGKGGDNAGLKAFAEKTLPVIQDHEKMAENLPNATTLSTTTNTSP